MTSTLREEIINEIDLATREKRISPSNYVQLADEIIQLFEKRIDELLPDSDYQLITKERIKEMLR